MVTALAAGIPARGVSVTGMDPNPDALRLARDASLGTMSVRGGIPGWAAELFAIGADGVPTVSPDVRRCTAFVEGCAPDDLPDPADGRFDAVFCRNLAIYLSPEGRRAIGARLRGLVRPGGLLFLGHAERLTHLGIEDSFDADGPGHPGSFAAERLTAAATPPPTAPALRGGHATVRPPAGMRASAPPPLKLARVDGHAGIAGTAPPDHVRQDAAGALGHVRALADRGDLREALEAARRLHDTGSRDLALLELLGTLHLALNEHAQAEAVLRSVTYLDPGNPTALLQLGALAERRGDAEQAARYRARAARSAG